MTRKKYDEMCEKYRGKEVLVCWGEAFWGRGYLTRPVRMGGSGAWWVKLGKPFPAYLAHVRSVDITTTYVKLSAIRRVEEV